MDFLIFGKAYNIKSLKEMFVMHRFLIAIGAWFKNVKNKLIHMNNTIKIDHLISQIMQLDKQTRTGLINRLTRLLKGNDWDDKNAIIKISDLEGLGSEIWKNVDIDHYIRQERQWD